MTRPPPRSNRPDTPFPYPTLFRSGRVVPQGHDCLDRRDRGVQHHLVTHRHGGDVVAHSLDHHGHVAARNVRQPRLGLPLGEPEVHVDERAGHGPDRHVVPHHLRNRHRPPPGQTTPLAQTQPHPATHRLNSPHIHKPPPTA